MLWFWSILVFLVMFSVIVIIHELGHFVTARWSGVKVHEFGLGMGKRLFTLGQDKKGCIFTINLIPFGGFVSLEGEDMENIDDKPLNPEAFYSKPWWKRSMMILAGVTMNYLLALIILMILFMRGTTPILLSQADVKQEIEKGTIVLGEGIPVIEVQKEGAAAQAGLQKNDIVLRVNNQAVKTPKFISDLQTMYSSLNYQILRPQVKNPAEITDLSKVKDFKSLNLVIKPNADHKIGVAFSSYPMIKEIKTVQYSFKASFMESNRISAQVAKSTVQALGSLVKRLLTKAELPEGVAGPVGIAAMTHTIVQEGNFDGFWKFVALISLSLAVINVLPIPALDGGRFLFLLIELISPWPIKAKWQGVIHQIAYLLLLGLIFLVTSHDIYNLFVK
ncbi:MAG TPA: site-2 protease family protein [Candidatus Gracilibacteria bacterium]|nr:site-2 protease family protein [Candidatus Gracilibacteria bacterium]